MNSVLVLQQLQQRKGYVLGRFSAAGCVFVLGRDYAGVEACMTGIINRAVKLLVLQLAAAKDCTLGPATGTVCMLCSI
jgi:hypothetical protein